MLRDPRKAAANHPLDNSLQFCNNDPVNAGWVLGAGRAGGRSLTPGDRPPRGDSSMEADRGTDALS